MRLIRFLLALALAPSVMAQTNVFTPVTATGLTVGGTPITTGTLTVTPVDATGAAISIRTADNQVFLPGAAMTAPISSGAITSGLQVPDQCTARSLRSTSPVSMLVTVTATVGGKVVTSSFTAPANASYFCGADPVAINAYAPLQVGLVGVTGIVAGVSPPARCIAPSLFYQTVSPFALVPCVAGHFGPVVVTPVAPTPTATPAAGTFTGAQSVTLAASSGTIHYTVNGTTPTCSSATYSTALTVSASTTVKALTCASGLLDSAVLTAAYTINTAQPGIFGGVGTPGATSTVTISGTTATLSTGNALARFQVGAEAVNTILGPYTANGQSVYLLLTGGAHTFTDNGTGFPFAFNAPTAVTATENGTTVTKYLYESTNALNGTFNVKVAN